MDEQQVNDTQRDLKARLNEAEAEADITRERLARSDEEILQLRRRRDELEDAKRALTEELRTVKYERESAVAESNTLRSRSDELTERMTAAEYECSCMRDALERERTEGRRTNERLSDVTLKNTAIIADADAATAEAKMLRSRLEQVEVAESSLRMRCDERAQTVADLDRRLAESQQELKEGRQERMRALEKYSSESQQMEERCAELEMAASRATAELEAFRNELQPTLRRACTERDELRLEQVTWQRDKDRMEETIDQLQQICDELREDRDHLRRRLHATEFEVEEHKQEITRLQGKLDDVLTTRAQHVASPRRAQREDAAAKKIQALHRGRQARQEADCLRVQSDRESLAAVRIQSLARQRKARKEVEQRRYAMLERRIEELQRSIKAKDDDVQTARTDTAELGDRLAECRAELDSSEAREAALRRERQELLQRQEDLLAKADDAQASEELAASATERLHSENSMLREKLQACEDTLAALKGDRAVLTRTAHSPQSPAVTALQAAVDDVDRVAESLRGDEVDDTLDTPRRRLVDESLAYVPEASASAARGRDRHVAIEARRPSRSRSRSWTPPGKKQNTIGSVGMLERAATAALREIRTHPDESTGHDASAVLAMLSKAVDKSRTHKRHDPTPTSTSLLRDYIPPARHDPLPRRSNSIMTAQGAFRSVSNSERPQASATHAASQGPTQYQAAPLGAPSDLERPFVSPPRGHPQPVSLQTAAPAAGQTRYISPEGARDSTRAGTESVMRNYNFTGYTIPKRRQPTDFAELDHYRAAREVREREQEVPPSQTLVKPYEAPPLPARHSTPSSRRDPGGPPVASFARSYGKDTTRRAHVMQPDEGRHDTALQRMASVEQDRRGTPVSTPLIRQASQSHERLASASKRAPSPKRLPNAVPVRVGYQATLGRSPSAESHHSQASHTFR